MIETVRGAGYRLSPAGVRARPQRLTFSSPGLHHVAGWHRAGPDQQSLLGGSGHPAGSRLWRAAADHRCNWVLCWVRPAVALGTILDTLRGARLLGWISGHTGWCRPATVRRSGVSWAISVENAPLRERETIGVSKQRLDQFLTAIEASPNGVLLLDADDQIEWCNGCGGRAFRSGRRSETCASASPTWYGRPRLSAYLQVGVYQDQPLADCRGREGRQPACRS